jgi:lipopolysaccharide export system permease protein
MSILSRYTIKEILSHLAGVLVIVVAIFMVGHFADFLSDAAAGDLPSGVLLQLLGLRTIMALPSLLPVGLYVAVLLGLGRLHEDNELTALATCGVSPARIYGAVLGFSVLAAVASGAVSFWARPWAAVTFHAVRDRAVREAGLGQISPGRFYELRSGTELAVFAESRSASDPRFVENVFVQQRDAEGTSVLVAARAVELVDAELGYRFLRLLDGYRYDLGADARHCDITQYEELVIRAPLAGAVPDTAQDHSLSALALARSSDPEDAAELQWRIASPVSAFLLVLLAIPLSRISPRRGQYARLFVAMLFYLGYSQLLGMVKKWVANGVWPTLPGTWAVHALCLATVLILLLAHRPAGLWPLRSSAPTRWSPRARSGPELNG